LQNNDDVSSIYLIVIRLKLVENGERARTHRVKKTKKRDVDRVISISLKSLFEQIRMKIFDLDDAIFLQKAVATTENYENILYTHTIHVGDDNDEYACKKMVICVVIFFISRFFNQNNCALDQSEDGDGEEERTTKKKNDKTK
jgi:hypothetical protein